MIEDIPMKSHHKDVYNEKLKMTSVKLGQRHDEGGETTVQELHNLLRGNEAHHKEDTGRSKTMAPKKPHDMAHYGHWNTDATVSIPTREKRKKRPDEDDMNAKGKKSQDTEYNKAMRLMDIQFSKTKFEKFTLCHQKLKESDAKYFCSELPRNFSLKKLKFRNCNVDRKFLLAIKKDGKVEHANFSGNNQIDLSVLKDLMTQWGCKSLDLSNIEFDENKMNDLQRISELPQLETLILDYSSFPVTSNAMKHVVKLLQNLENLSFVSSTISTDQLGLIADNLSDRIKLQSLNLTHVQLENKGLEAVCKIINHTLGMKKLSLSNSGLTAEKLKVFSDTVTQKIEELDLGLNRNIGPTDLKKIIEIVKRPHVSKLNLSGVALNKQARNQPTASDIPCGQLKTLILDYSSFSVTSNAMGYAAKLFQGLEHLSLVSSTISTVQLVLIANNLSKRIKLQSLNLSHVQLENKGLKAVCKIINKTNGMKKLSLSNSGLTAGKLKVFSKKVTQKIEELDLGLNRSIGPTDLKKVIKIVKRQHVSILNLSGLALNQRALKQLTASDIPCRQITELNISENSGICISDVGELAAKLEIQNLDISECWFRIDDLKKLPSSMNNHKLRWIDITESCRVLSEERRKEILSILCTVAEEVRIEKA